MTKPMKEIVGFALYVPLTVLTEALVIVAVWTADKCLRLADWVER